MCAKYDTSRCPDRWRSLFHCEKNGNSFLAFYSETPLSYSPFSFSHFPPTIYRLGNLANLASLLRIMSSLEKTQIYSTLTLLLRYSVVIKCAWLFHYLIGKIGDGCLQLETAMTLKCDQLSREVGIPHKWTLNVKKHYSK